MIKQQAVSQWGAKDLLLDNNLGVADTAGENFYQHFALFWHLGLNLLDDERAALLFEHGGRVGLGDLRGHADSGFDGVA